MVSIDKEMKPSMAPSRNQHKLKTDPSNGKYQNDAISSFSCSCCKLNDSEAKNTGIAPYYFIVVIVMPWAWRVVIVLSLLINNRQ